MSLKVTSSVLSTSWDASRKAVHELEQQQYCGAWIWTCIRAKQKQIFDTWRMRIIKRSKVKSFQRTGLGNLIQDDKLYLLNELINLIAIISLVLGPVVLFYTKANQHERAWRAAIVKNTIVPEKALPSLRCTHVKVSWSQRKGTHELHHSRTKALVSAIVGTPSIAGTMP
jgi:hypothetical protein